MWFFVTFSLFSNISNPFVDTMIRLNDIFFSPKCIYSIFESLCSFKFFHLSRFRNRNAPPNVILRKFQHFFSTLKHYNLSIYTVKWPQICSTPSTTCTLQYCTVEIFIPYSTFDLQRQAVLSLVGPLTFRG